MKRTLNIAVIGAGWMGFVHSEAFLRVPSTFPELDCQLILHTIVDVNPDSAKNLARKCGYKNWTTRWQDAVENKEIDIIDVCVPNFLHKEIVLAAAEAGKDILCEKPLGLNSQEDKEMVAAVEKNNVINMVGFNYRRIPALQYVKQMLDAGELGEIYRFHGIFLQDFYFDPNSPMTWRFKKATAGGGSLVTMGSHIIDLACWLVGDIEELCADVETIVKERKWPDGKLDTVEVDDATRILVRFSEGFGGYIETCWMALGRRVHIQFEISGSKGAINFNSERLNEINFCAAEHSLTRGFKTILIGEAHPYGEHFYLKTGMGIGLKESYLIQMYEFAKAVLERKETDAPFRDGLRVDKIIEAAQRSAEARRWINLKND